MLDAAEVSQAGSGDDCARTRRLQLQPFAGSGLSRDRDGQTTPDVHPIEIPGPAHLIRLPRAACPLLCQRIPDTR
jgi:hypothetical protein